MRGYDAWLERPYQQAEARNDALERFTENYLEDWDEDLYARYLADAPDDVKLWEEINDAYDAWFDDLRSP